MSKSITYYLTLLVIRIKGIKKHFSHSPINYLAIRKEDVHVPKNRFFTSSNTKTYTIKKTKVTEINNNENLNKLLLYIPGGAFISGPAQHHWNAVERITKETNYTIWMCDYPKAPEHKIFQISDNIDAVYKIANEKFNCENILLMGDSAGGTLIIALIQRLIQSGNKLPSKIVLISPVLDASFENPEIDSIDKIDPMLSKAGVISAKKMCSEDGNLKHVSLSPINGSFKGFPTTYLFIAENDITYPDQLLLLKKLEQSHVEHTVNIGNGMPHIWPLLPVMNEAKNALNKIIDLIKE